MLFDHAFKQEFSDIRCYDDSEISSVLQSLHSHGESLFGLISSRSLNLNEFFNQRTIHDLQSWVNQHIVPEVLSSTVEQISVKNITDLDPSRNYIFVSNHRDIAMDPLVVNLTLMQHGFKTAHNAIGENLLINPISKALAGLNKCFCVNRTQRSPKAMLRALKRQSKYISHVHHQLGENIWIAQREGRSLDNNDHTNPALLKMLSLNADRDSRAQALQALNIVPVSISYEWDPCDASKASRLVQTDSNLDSGRELASKAQQDFQDVVNGLRGHKGNIAICFGRPLKLDPEIVNINDVFDAFSQSIDRFIQTNYQLFANNFAACELLGLDYPASLLKKFSIQPQDIAAAHSQFNTRLQEYDSNPSIKQAVLKLYTNNLINAAGL